LGYNFEHSFEEEEEDQRKQERIPAAAWLGGARSRDFSAQRQEKHQHKLEKKIWERSCRQARKAGTHYRPALMEEFAAREMGKSGAALDVPLELLG
jgi:hypothetical protein